MFEKTIPVFIYCVSPVHMGAGTAIGVIDNPIQRERHTEYPMIAGSGLKGAIRHDFLSQANGSKGKVDLISRIFGPDPDSSSDHAGAISLSDAQLVAFPVRCTKNAFVYASSATILARVNRTLSIAGIETPWGSLPALNEGECLVSDKRCTSKEKLVLEAFEFTAKDESNLKTLAEWISRNAIPNGAAFDFFREKIKSDMVLLSNEDFSYFVRNATVVEPHVRIDDVSGTAVEGGLFYTENLPPEALLLCLAMASRERLKEGKGMNAEEIRDTVLTGKASGKETGFRGIDGRMLQIGGDATTGRGQVFVRAVLK
jgi:CRISPR-associated protein Cmr4